MPKRIYISSTFRDLKEYREQAIDTLKYLEGYFELVTPMEYMLPGLRCDGLAGQWSVLVFKDK